MVLKQACPSIAIAFIAVTGSLAAQDTPIEISAATLTVEMQGQTVTLPRPSWSIGKADELASEVFREVHAEGVEIIEFIPAGESFDTWTHMSAALVVAQPGYTADTHMGSVIDAFTA